MHNKFKYALIGFLLIFLFLTFYSISAAKESSVFNLGVDTRDIYAKDQSFTISYDLWIGNVDPSDHDFMITFDVSSLTGADVVILYLRLWELNDDDFWASYGELNWSTRGTSSDPIEVGWYDIISPSLAGSTQKLDFCASTGDSTKWEAELTVEISIIAAFVTEGWISNPQNSDNSATQVITPGFEVWLVMTPLVLVFCYQKKRR
ncbi:MAG: hypothetical protein ACFFDT_10630 [Candidatus Hodarchaeota archaeon]